MFNERGLYGRFIALRYRHNGVIDETHLRLDVLERKSISPMSMIVDADSQKLSFDCWGNDIWLIRAPDFYENSMLSMETNVVVDH